MIRDSSKALFPSFNNMKAHKVLSSQILKRKKLKTVIPHSSALCSSTSQLVTSDQSQTASSQISPELLIESVRSSQWHFIKHQSSDLNPSVISTVLLNLHKTPELALQFTSHIEFQRLDVKTRCLAIAVASRLPSPKPTLQLLKQTIYSDIASVTVIFDELALARDRLGISTTILFDLLIRACCEMKRVDEGLECFYMMKDKGLIPKIETCNDMLSTFLKLNRTESAWVLYAEMFKMRIKSSIYTFNIMINVLCKEGKLKKAKEFVNFMENLAVKPNVVTYNTLIHAYCSRGRVEGARLVLNAMRSKGIELDSYTYSSLISGMCKEKRLEEASEMFEKMKEMGLVPSAITYNTLIDGYCNYGDLEKAFGYRDEMVERGILPTVSTYNLLVHALFMECKMGQADDLVKEMREKGLVADEITYNILINGYSRCGNVKKAFSFHDEMLTKGIQPTQISALHGPFCDMGNAMVFVSGLEMKPEVKPDSLLGHQQPCFIL
ncbi:Pentatricopeptide repeat superfamily protein isoform 6 [Theobroma cacao]|uniref:Pentatricopeptide repeat superfamily protein isoform 6 n=1 Tax=Theobroma cacao TaxID=3641 RepID=A0A061DYS3_THECC|nr:Pentatricopeptide repeat superfamily protein isoform 6 [Theobroma cacao]